MSLYEPLFQNLKNIDYSSIGLYKFDVKTLVKKNLEILINLHSCTIRSAKIVHIHGINTELTQKRSAVLHYQDTQHNSTGC